MAHNLVPDRRPRPVIEPGGQHAIDAIGVPVAEMDHQLVARVGSDARNGRVADDAGNHAKGVKVTAVAEARAIGQPAPGTKLIALALVAGDVSTEPALSLGKEATDLPLRVLPATPRRWRDGDDDPAPIVDRDTEAPRPRRPSQRVLDHTTGQARDGPGLVNGRHTGTIAGR